MNDLHCNRRASYYNKIQAYIARMPSMPTTVNPIATHGDRLFIATPNEHLQAAHGLYANRHMPVEDREVSIAVSA